MACGCADICNCYLLTTDTVSITGAGTEASPYRATVLPDPEGGLQNGEDGVGILIDPASTLPWSLGEDGLLLDCCEAGNLAEPAIVVYEADDDFAKADYPGMTAVKVRVIGGGGGSGSCEATGAGEASAAGGGGGGEYAERIILVADMGVTESITIGTGGGGGSAGTNNGSAGTTSSFGAIVSAGGGSGGQYGPAGTANVSSGGKGGTGGTGGDIHVQGSDGGAGANLTGDGLQGFWGNGGASGGGMGGTRTKDTGSLAAKPGYPYGGGAAGGTLNQSTAASAGADGADGVVIVEIIR